MTTQTTKWKDELEQIFSASVNQQTLEEAAKLIVSVSTLDLSYHEEILSALNEGLQAARTGDNSVIGLINKSGYQVSSAIHAADLLEDFLRIYLTEFRRAVGDKM